MALGKTVTGVSFTYSGSLATGLTISFPRSTLKIAPEPTTLRKHAFVFFSVIGLAVLPAPEKNADPFEGERPHSGLVRLAFGPLFVIIGSRPFRLNNRMQSPLVKGFP